MSKWTEAIQTWEACRNGVANEVRAMGTDYLDVQPSDGTRTAREVAIHIMEAGAAYLGKLATGGPVQRGDPIDVPADADADALATALMEQWTNVMKPRALALEGRADMEIESFFGKQSTMSQLWFAVSHEWYHRGQLATYVRLSGNVPALTRFIEEQQAKARAGGS